MPRVAVPTDGGGSYASLGIPILRICAFLFCPGRPVHRIESIASHKEAYPPRLFRGKGGGVAAELGISRSSPFGWYKKCQDEPNPILVSDVELHHRAALEIFDCIERSYSRRGPYSTFGQHVLPRIRGKMLFTKGCITDIRRQRSGGMSNHVFRVFGLPVSECSKLQERTQLVR